MTEGEGNTSASPLSYDEIRRYARHLTMPEIGLGGQERIKAARVLLVGAGGLASCSSLYLAAAGVGKLGIVDFDLVDHSDLQRQILYSAEDIGKAKVKVAAERIRDVNPHVDVEVYETRLTPGNALEIFGNYEVIVDCSDNFPTRYLVNDACVLLKKPDIYGSVFRFEGQASVFAAGGGPCYRCIYPEPPPAGLSPDCEESGVLGVLPGIIGSIQATEVLKLTLGRGELLVGRMLVFDALKMQFTELDAERNPDCPICGSRAVIHHLIDYEKFCGSAAPASTAGGNRDTDISVETLKQHLDREDKVLLLDVREPHEYQTANLGGHLIPLGQLPNRFQELPRDREIIVHCHHGIRSRYAVEFLRQNGFANVKNLVGGIDQWSLRVDPAIPRY
jgi:sulfur-carrier protein adenylyltransferase/sulfurtransferase